VTSSPICRRWHGRSGEADTAALKFF